VKIIKQADTAEWSFRATCDNCDSELQVEANDVKFVSHPDYGPREPGWDEYYATCPVCSSKIGIPESKVPKALRIKAKSKSSYGGPLDR
jgi:hypothetical protein